MGSKVRVAVIGCGAQGANHLRAYRQVPGVEIVAVCDTNSARLEQTGTEFEVPNRYPDYQQLLEGGRYDLVSICTMPVSHHEMATSAFARGANVLCEKPMAMNAGEAVAMVDAARRADRFLTVGVNMRYLPKARYLQRFVVEGHLGRPVYTRAWAFANDIPWWGKHYVKGISGGGALASTAVHVLDLALWVAGHPQPVSASASMTSVFPKKRSTTAPDAEAAASFDVEDTISGHIRFADGSWMTLEGAWSWDRPDYSYSFEMAGNAATIQFAPLRVVREQDGVPVDVTPLSAQDNDWQGSWRASIEAEIADVVAAVRDESEPLIRAEEALMVQTLVDALYESAEARQEVTLTPPGEPAATA